MGLENNRPRPPFSEVFGTRLRNKIRAIGEKDGITEEAVVDQIATQYPNKSMNELAHELGLSIKPLRKLLDYAGVKRLTVSEAAKLSKDRGKGIFGITDEDRRLNAINAGRKSLESGKGIHSFTAEQLSQIGKKGGDIAGKKTRDQGTGIFAFTKEQKREVAIKAGKTSFANRAGFHSFSPEQRRQQAHKAAARVVELGKGIHALSNERRREIAKEAGRKSATMRVATHGIDPKTGEKFGVRAGRRSFELGAGIHKQTHEDHLRLGLQASETMSLLKVMYEGNYYDSRVEAAAAVSLERFIPDFVITRGENYQVVIPEVSKKVDFVINDVLVEYNPIILWYSGGYLGSFDTKEEFDAYLGHRDSLPDSERVAYVRQTTEELRQRYYERRRTAIDENPDYRDKELVVVVNPEQLYRQVITRFGQGYPPTSEDFVGFFKSTLRQVNRNNRQEV